MDKDVEHTKCIRCGREIEKISSVIPLSEYCRECFQEIKDMIDRGAVIVEKQKTPSWSGYRVYKRGEEYVRSEELSKSKAIILGKRVSQELDADLLYKDDQENTMWTMENYLEKHPEVKRNVEDLENDSKNPIRGLIEKARNIFS
ncbi:MAG: hypothetical protein ACOCSA_02780 [Candidatus Hadarchaeota archaeon]